MSNRIDDGVLSRRRAKRGYAEAEDSASDSHNNNNGNGSSGSRSRSKRTSTGYSQQPEEGCVICKQDNDHANLLLCEGCDAESHIYCLNPPLLVVPEGDWFCGTFIFTEFVD